MPYIPNDKFNYMCQDEAGHDEELKNEIERLKGEIRAKDSLINLLLDRIAKS